MRGETSTRAPHAGARAPRSIDIGGRTFVSVQESTYAHDLWVQRVLAEIGLRDRKPVAGESPDDFMLRLHADLVRSGQTLELLGGLLVPRGKAPDEWTPELAHETARHLGAVRSDEDKATLDNLVAELLVDFFQRGWLSSLRSSAISSTTTEAPPASPTEETTAATGSGVESSARSPVETTT
jgi:hypothetical protein